MENQKEQAKERFRQLVAKHGLRWNHQTPREAYEAVQEIDKILTPAEKREALGLPTTSPQRSYGSSASS